MTVKLNREPSIQGFRTDVRGFRVDVDGESDRHPRHAARFGKAEPVAGMKSGELAGPHPTYTMSYTITQNEYTVRSC